MKKAKKKRKYETEEDSDPSERERIFPSYPRQPSGMRKYRMLNPPRAVSGGRSSPGGYILHHNFRYAPEPPARNSPKQEHARQDHELELIPEQTSKFSKRLLADLRTVMLGVMSITLIFIGIHDLRDASGLLLYATGFLGIALTAVYVLQKAFPS